MHSSPLHGKQGYRGGGGGRHGGQGGLGGDGGGAGWLVQGVVVCCIVLHKGGGGAGDHWCVVLVHRWLLMAACIVCINWFRLQSFNS